MTKPKAKRRVRRKATQWACVWCRIWVPRGVGVCPRCEAMTWPLKEAPASPYRVHIKTKLPTAIAAAARRS